MGQHLNEKIRRDKSKMRNNKLKLVISILVAVVIILLACIAIIFVGKKALDEKQDQINELQYEIDANKQIVYVSMADISAGQTLTEGENIMKQEVFTGLESEYYMQPEMVGGIATVDIKALQPIMDNMVTTLEITKDSREYEIAVANLMTDQAEYDYIDVRIMFPTGEDYTILTKKDVHNLNLESCCFYSYLNEDEIVRMASAIIDAYTVTGTYIYTTRYIEPSLQDEAIPNYVVRPEVIDLINSDPNILTIAKETLNLQARINLEERLRGLSDDALKAVADGHQIADTAKDKVLLDVQYSANGQGEDQTESEEYEYSEENDVTETEEASEKVEE